MSEKEKTILLPEGKLDIKSPIFTPRPGWGGKLNGWFLRKTGLRSIQILALIAWLTVLVLWLTQ